MTKIKSVQALLAVIVILGAAVLAEVLTPRELMARSSAAMNLEQIIPQKFGDWAASGSGGLVTPDTADYIEPDPNSARIYAQEVGRTYVDREGHILMLMVAYGPVQNFRLKAHRPEICYTAAGFRVSQKTGGEIALNTKASPLPVTRLVTERETRFEPVSYWMRVGNDVSSGIIDRQLIRLKYGLRGIIPDGALIRVSTIGIPAEQSFKLQDQFVKDLMTAIAPENRKFLIGQG